jgi:hypothetical protein
MQRTVPAVRVRLAPLVQQLQQQSAGKLLVIEGSMGKL